MLEFSKQNKLKNIYKEIFQEFKNYNHAKSMTNFEERTSQYTLDLYAEF